MKQWTIILACLAAALDPEFTTSAGKTYRLMLSLASKQEVVEGCSFPCAKSCVLYSAELVQGGSMLTSDEVKECVQYCGCAAFLPEVQSAQTTELALPPECSARCGRVCVGESPECMESCSHQFCTAQLIYTPDKISTPVFTVMADLLAVIISIGVVHALYRRLSGKSKKEWKSAAVETPYSRLDY